MKKQALLLIAAMSAASVTFVSAKNEQIISLDSIRIMQESKEGKILAEKLKGRITEYQEFVKKSQQEVVALQDEVSKKSDLLSKEALEEKTARLNQKKKDLERVIGDREESLRAELQREQIKLRDKQLAVANNLCQEEQWAMVIDKNTPGVLFVNKAIDKTTEVLRKVDELYEKNKSTTVASNKPVVAKTAAKKA